MLVHMLKHTHTHANDLEEYVIQDHLKRAPLYDTHQFVLSSERKMFYFMDLLSLDSGS